MSNDIDWNTDDDLEIENYSLSSSRRGEFIADSNGSAEASSSNGPSNSNLVSRFVGMGFPEKMVAKAIEENGEGNSDAILECLLTTENCSLSSSRCGEFIADSNGSAEASSSNGPSNSNLVSRFVGMGFPEKMVAKAIEENGEGNSDAILECLLTYSALESSPLQQQKPIDSDDISSDFNESFLDDFSDTDSWADNEDMPNSLSEKENKVLFLADMGGYTAEEVYVAIERCGPDASVDELANYLFAAQMAKAEDIDLGEEVKPRLNHVFSGSGSKKRRNLDYELWKRKKQRGLLDGDEEIMRLPNPMIGFGVPTESFHMVHRRLPEAAVGPPYFYYENVALAPKGVWSTISRFLYEIEPEFVDSKFFCAAARKRGYVHNLPLGNRFPLLPFPPQTIHEAFPLTKKWWPSWDTRTKFNCLQTAYGSAKNNERVRNALKNCDVGRDPPERVQNYVMGECRKWNLVWVGQNKVATLEPDEVEMLLGFPKNHTRGISRTDRYKSLGNSFQVDTVAYHLSVLKEMFPGGVNVLSLFSGIGGAEVALHRLGIPLKNVVSVEKSEVNREVVRSWWEQTKQKGTLIDMEDVQELNSERLEQLIGTFGGFDLIVGGSPCNNLAGSNRHHRDGLEGTESVLFYDYFRILDLVKCIMGRT